MIKPHPFTLSCPSCHWKKTFTPQSDCLRAGVDWEFQSPQCGHRELVHRIASRQEVVLKRLVDFLGKNP